MRMLTWPRLHRRRTRSQGRSEASPVRMSQRRSVESHRGSGGESPGEAELARPATGSRRARFERCARDAFGALLGLARKLERDPVAAEDLVQDALVKAYDRFDQLADERR